MAEKSIMAYFHSPDDANRLLPKLKALGTIDVQVARIGQFQGDGVSETFNPLTGGFPGLSFLTLNNESPGIDEGILAAADVDASGLSAPRSEDGYYDHNGVGNMDILLTVVIEEQAYEQAQRIVREGGGFF
ncbi:hypothetical protein [Paenibacillus sp. FSL H8-0034]|uniref:hypothetical protein n=1 Tax=Paenibacillus sp. FSL H8-0034 TaxID=2954671 RepID=UPI0030F6EC45